MYSDSKGQVALFTIMFATVIIILAMAFAPIIVEFTTDARGNTTNTHVGLSCDNSSISDFDKAGCLAVDSFNWYFLGFMIAFAGSIIGARLLFSEQ